MKKPISRRARIAHHQTKFIGYDLSQKIDGSEFVDVDEYDAKPWIMLDPGPDCERMFFARYATWSVKKRMNFHLHYTWLGLKSAPAVFIMAALWSLCNAAHRLAINEPNQPSDIPPLAVYVLYTFPGVLMLLLMLLFGLATLASARFNPANQRARNCSLANHGLVTAVIYLAWIGLTFALAWSWLKIARPFL